jgi:hypothetical protein
MPFDQLVSNPPASPFPDALEFYLGAPDGRDCHELTYSNGLLWYRGGTTLTELLPGDVSCTADEARWARFCDSLKRIGVGNLKPDHSNPKVLEGEGLRLEIMCAGRALKSGGDSGYCPTSRLEPIWTAQTGEA